MSFDHLQYIVIDSQNIDLAQSRSLAIAVHRYQTLQSCLYTANHIYIYNIDSIQTIQKGCLPCACSCTRERRDIINMQSIELFTSRTGGRATILAIIFKCIIKEESCVIKGARGLIGSYIQYIHFLDTLYMSPLPLITQANCQGSCATSCKSASYALSC